VNHKICHIWGILFKTFESTCSVCGSESLPDYDDWMPDERILTEGAGESLIQVQVDQDLDAEDFSNRN
jgi:hypothetical protein